MHAYELLSQKFALHFDKKHFPAEPDSLYGPNNYFLQLGGKRARPVACLMGNELCSAQEEIYLLCLKKAALPATSPKAAVRTTGTRCGALTGNG